MPKFTLLEGATFFTAISEHMEGATKKAVQKAARVVRDEAKRVLGTYDYDWPSLAESTIERKATGDSPGLETGAMRQSIKASVSGEKGHYVAHVGTDDPHAQYFELGTVKQPPRSFLAGAAQAKEHEVQEICGVKVFESVLTAQSASEDDWSYDGED